MADRDDEDTEELLREAVERSRSGAPAVGHVVRDRFSADEVFQRIIAAADEEITSGSRELFFSGLAAGFAITITFLLLASLTYQTDGHPILGAMLYPLGFIYIIIGGYQLYTENTLPPVALTLERLASVPALLRNWIVVLAGNFTGGLAGAAALAFAGVLSSGAATEAANLAQKGIDTAPTTLFVKAAFAGLIVAGVVWINYAARDTLSRMVIVYLAFLAIPLGGLYHVVVSFTEMMYLVFLGRLSLAVGVLEFVVPVLLGNTAGGVVLVTVVNYFQTTEERIEAARFEGAHRKLSLKEWAFGGLVGRSYVPVVDTAWEGDGSEDGPYKVVVPIANPRTELALVRFACTLASVREGATVHVVHVVQTPGGRVYGTAQDQRIVDESDRKLEEVRSVVEGYDVNCETSTLVSHRAFEELFGLADREGADLVVMGWAKDRLWDDARAERPLGELTNTLPCDFLVVKDRDLRTDRILLPTVGGPNSELSARVARTLREVADANVTLLHVVETREDWEEGDAFLEAWAADNGLSDAERVVETGGNVEASIARHAKDHPLVLIGATERGLLSRLARDSLHLDVVHEIDSSVVLVERAAERDLVTRLFGRNQRGADA